jgi:4-hydroxythreonine-4-phosphate dehydrogenase
MSTANSKRPLVGLTLGDPAGIGPEIALAALRDADVRREMRVLAIGPAALRPPDVVSFDRAGDGSAIDDVAWLATTSPARWEMGRVQAECGRAALEALRVGVELARAKRIDALVTGPVSKAALHAAGEKVEGQTELLGRWDGVERFEMIAIAGRMRVMLLSRHMPLLAAIASITGKRIVEHLVLLDETLRGWGFHQPRIALAGLNPHAGEQGQLGREELDVLAPALELARAQGVDVAGPISPDSVFIQASRGSFDAVLALYHDQAFIPVKLAAPETGLTVIAGLSFLRVSPAHGTAFDIAGKGLASAKNLIVALRQAAAWSTGRPIAVVE